MTDSLTKEFSMPATATTGIQDYDLEGEGRKKPGRGASKKKGRAAPAPKHATPKQPPRATSSSGSGKKKPATHQGQNGEVEPQTDDSIDENGDDEIDAGQDPEDPSEFEDEFDEEDDDADKMDSANNETGSADAFDTNPNSRGYGKMNKVDITTFDESQLAAFFEMHKATFLSDELVKGVYDVAQLGSLISQLKYMADASAVERQIEGDDSKVPEQLRDAAASLLNVLSDMASEEAGEMQDGTTAEDVMRDTQPTMTPGLYRTDVGPLAKSLRTALFGVDESALAKVGARNSAKDLETLQKCHDALCELGAACAAPPGPHANDGVDVKPEETTKMANGQVSKTDTISAEGNKRGAAVSDPKPGQQSTNAEDAEVTSDQGQEKPVNDTKKGKKRMDMTAAQKKKARMDMDDDEDEDEDEDEDMDEDEDFPPPAKKKKAAKSFNTDDLAKTIAGAVATAVVTAMAQMNKMEGGSNVPPIARVNPPNLLQVGKDGAVQKVDVDTLRKSVDKVAAAACDPGDNDTATLIKAIHRNGGFRLNPNQIPN